MASGNAQPIAGSEGASFPFWSPDSRFVAFFAGGTRGAIPLDADVERAGQPFVYVGSSVTSVSFTIDNGDLICTAHWMGLDLDIDEVATAPTFSTWTPFGPGDIAISIPNNTPRNDIDNFSIEKQVEGENIPQRINAKVTAFKSRNKVRGAVSTPQNATCRPNRNVSLFKRRKGSDRLIGTDVTGAAILVLPGGGYAAVAMDLEGTEICDWITSQPWSDGHVGMYGGWSYPGFSQPNATHRQPQPLAVAGFRPPHLDGHGMRCREALPLEVQHAVVTQHPGQPPV